MMSRINTFLVLAALILAGTAQSIRLTDIQDELTELWSSGHSEALVIVRMIWMQVTSRMHNAFSALAESDGPAEILVKYIVKPSEEEDFVKEFSKAAKAVADEEKGSKIFTLSKTATDNFQLWEYAAWETAEDLKEHIKSDHVKDLAKYIFEHDIIIEASPLIKLVEEK
eukprot:jgi/Astpho2/2401/Aster-05659